jgi:hypothetical protein
MRPDQTKDFQMAMPIGRKMLSAAAAATCAMGILTVPAPAAAIPMVPLSPPCGWLLPEGLWLQQDNDIRVIVPTADNQLRGTAQYYKGHEVDRITDGTAQGFLNGDGYTFKFTMNWNKGPGAGLSNTYYGQINDDGSITGYTENNSFVRNNFTGQQRAQCGGPPPPPPEVGVPDPVH